MIELPSLDPPPRFVPLGVRLQVLNHHSVSGTLWLTLPAAVVLLLAAIGQPARGARTALVVFGAVLLLLGVRMGLPPLRQGLRRVQRMATGILAMGRIVSCRIEGAPERDAKPYAEFLRKYGAIGSARALSMGLGSVLGLFVLPFATLVGLMIIAFVITAIARLFNPAIEAGDMDFDHFLRFCLAFIGFLVMFLAVRTIWRRASVPLVRGMVRGEIRAGAASGDEYHRERIQQAFDDAAELGLDAPLPERGSGILLTCTVEYVAMGELRTATGGAILDDHLNLAGIEPLLFDPSNPGEVDLFAGFSPRIKVKDGRWWPIRWTGSGATLAIACGVLALDAFVLLEEIVALVR